MSSLTTAAHTRRSGATVSEGCYVSCHTHFRLFGDPTIELSQPSEGGRTRTSGGSSDDQSPLKHGGFMDEAFRSGGPHICTIPAKTNSLSPDHPYYHQVMDNLDKLMDDVLSLLTKGGVRGVNNMVFCMRQSVFEKGAEQLMTLLVQARKTTFDSTWLEVSREVHNYFCSMSIPHCSIEIADDRAFDIDRISPLDPTDAIFAKWYQVVDSIWNNCYLEDVTSLGCFRIGRSDDWKQNPPTVLITVNPDIAQDWKVLREDVVLVLENHFLPMVAVKIKPDRFLRGYSANRAPDMPLDVLRGPALAGQSLGRRGLADRHGTFGGYLELRNPRTNEWIPFGITCTHCVLPEDDQVDISKVSLIHEWRKNGVPPEDENAQRHLKLDQPSLKDLTQAVEACESQISKHIDADFLQVQASRDAGGYIMDPNERKFLRKKLVVDQCTSEKTMIEQFCTSTRHHLGSVFAASGEVLWKPQTMRYPLCNMDWSLVQIRPSRMGDNTITTFGSAPRRFQIENGAKLRNWDGKQLEINQDLFKVGRLTGYTMGSYSGIKSAFIKQEVINGEIVHTRTYEHTLTGHFLHPFSLRGDSGSFVFDDYYNVVGLIFGRYEESNLSYFTHVTDLFDSIKQVTGATEVRIKEE